MERKLTLPIYFGAFLMSLALFTVGIFVGYAIDSSSLKDIGGDITSLSERVSSVQLILLMEGNSSSFCPVYLSELEAIDAEVEKAGYKLTYLEDEKGVYDNELKKRYFMLEGESYLLSKKVKGLCGDRSVLLINFYSNKDCARCKEQGGEILRVRDEVTSQGVKLKLFSFDGELGSPVAEAFEAQYGVKEYPSVAINDKTYSGFLSSEQLKNIIGEAQ